MGKAVFIINGTGGVGKDTVCEMAAALCPVRSVSSITPIVEIARSAGWDGVKTPASRRLLSRLKDAFTEYNDLPFRYCMQQVEEFLAGSERLMFLHVREPREIERLRQAVGPCCHTLLVRRPGVSGQLLGNPSDDGVEGYQYDAVIENDGGLDELREKVADFVAAFLA